MWKQLLIDSAIAASLLYAVARVFFWWANYKPKAKDGRKR